jgi:hypothetical protein
MALRKQVTRRPRTSVFFKKTKRIQQRMGPDGLEIILQKIAKPEMFVPEEKIAGVDAAIRKDGEFGGSSGAPDRIEAVRIASRQKSLAIHAFYFRPAGFDPVQAIIKIKKRDPTGNI